MDRSHSTTKLGAWGPGHVVAGKYTILHAIGQGGMGQVWRARHLGLGSIVALKSLDPRLATTDGGRARFLREAKAAAALQSPHVIQIHDYGVDGDTPFIAMELLEGESLAARLQRGPLSPEVAWRVLDHVLRAITKAHDVGFVHRDLKPANVFIVPNDAEESVLLKETWLCKVLDFGIVKSVDASAPSGDASTDGPATDTGAILGTPHYMSPEQARSRPVDGRSDLWSIGVMTYECLLGTRPFQADSFGGLVLAICSDPLPVPSEHGAVPPGFDAWFSRALERDAAKRFQSARELGLALRSVLLPATDFPSESKAAPPNAVPQSAAAAPPTETRRSRSRWPLGIALVGSVALAVGLYAVARRRDPVVPEAQLASSVSSDAPAPSPSGARSGPQVTPRQLTFDGSVRMPSLSLDGKSAFFVTRKAPGVTTVWRHDIASGASRALLDLGRVADLAVAPDGETLLVVGRVGTEEQTNWILLGADGKISQRAAGARFAPSWAADGRSFVGYDNSGGKELIIQSLDGTSRRLVITGTYDWLRETQWLAKSNRILVQTSNAAQEYQLALVAPDGGPAQPLAFPLVRWMSLAATDDALYVITQPTPSSDLLRFSFDPERATVGDRPETLLSGVHIADLGVTRDGNTIVYASDNVRSNLHMLEGEKSDASFRELTRGTKQHVKPQFSPDGSRLAYVRVAEQRELVVGAADGQGAVALSRPDEEILTFAWSPDSEQLAALAVQRERPEILLYPAAGGPARKIVTGLSVAGDEEALSWAPSSRLLARLSGNQNYARIDVTNGASSMVLSTVDGWVFSAQADHAGGLALFRNLASTSPKGRALWLVPSSGNPKQITEGDLYPVRFAADDKDLYVHARSDRAPSRIDRLRLGGGDKLTSIRTLDFGRNQVNGVDVTADGKRIVCSVEERERDLFAIDVAH